MTDVIVVTLHDRSHDISDACPPKMQVSDYNSATHLELRGCRDSQCCEVCTDTRACLLQVVAHCF
jgi:hypothetical protein